MAFHHKYNSDDVLIRAVIVGLVNELNNKINFENVWEDDRRELVRVPFFYAMSGDERFLQDYFSNWSDCAPDFIEGNLDPIPRGTVYLSSTAILASNLTSRYVRGYYTKEIDGELKRYNSYINSIPVQLNFTAEILADTTTDSFKIVQSIMSVFYKTLVFSVNFKGFRVPTQVGFPESENIEKQFEFTYGTTERIKVSFEVEVQTYLPIPESGQEFFAGKSIQGFAFDMQAGGDAPVNNRVQVPPVPSGINSSSLANTESAIGDPEQIAENQRNIESYMNPPVDPTSDSGRSDTNPSESGGNDLDNSSNYNGGRWQ